MSTERLPIETIQLIKEYIPRDRDMRSPAAKCLKYAMYYYNREWFSPSFHIWALQHYVGSLEEYTDLHSLAIGEDPGWEGDAIFYNDSE